MFKEKRMGTKLTKGRIQWFCNIVSLARIHCASQNFPLWMFPVEVATETTWHEIWRIKVKQQAFFFFFLNTRTIGTGTFISHMLLVYWLTSLAWNSRQAATAPPCPVSFFGCSYRYAKGMFSSMMKGTSISWRTPIASRLEAVRPEMSPSLWVIVYALGCQLFLALLYFISIYLPF